MTHEDDRRILESWSEAKIITAKENCELGKHYHKIKTEKFILISGSCWIYRSGGYPASMMVIGEIYTVEPGITHSFTIEKGSVLIGLCSHPYDPTDDYK